MWLCTQLGFFSIVRKRPDESHIRARCRNRPNPTPAQTTLEESSEIQLLPLKQAGYIKR